MAKPNGSPLLAAFTQLAMSWALACSGSRTVNLTLCHSSSCHVPTSIVGRAFLVLGRKKKPMEYFMGSRFFVVTPLIVDIANPPPPDSYRTSFASFGGNGSPYAW